MHKNSIKFVLLGIIISTTTLAQTSIKEKISKEEGSYMAESTADKIDSNIDETDDKFSVVTNRFFDNWFVSGGVGAQILLGDHDKQLDLKNRITPVYNFNIGKWFTPGMGLRFGVQGGNLKGATQTFGNHAGPFSTGKPITEKPWNGYWLTYSKFKYLSAYGDVLFNLSNLLAGYKPDRFYSLSLYAGAGYAQTSTPKNIDLNTPMQTYPSREFGVRLGILNTFRLSDPIDFNVDLNTSVFGDTFDGIRGQAIFDGIAAVSLGFTYKFNKRGWDQRTVVVKHVADLNPNMDELNDMRAKVASLTAENESLRNQKPVVPAPVTKVVNTTIVGKSVLAPPLLVTFALGKTDLSKEARVNLGYFARIVKAKPNVVYLLTGYADKGTGNLELNQKLSIQRADNVYNALVNEFGVNPAQLRKDAKGGVENMFYDDPRLSRAVIAFEIQNVEK